MRKLLIGILLLTTTGCYSFGRGVASRVVETLDTDRSEMRQCEIRGREFRGISDYLGKGETVKVLIVHGIGTHRPGHSAVITEGIAQSLGLTVFSNPTDLDILNPRDPAQRLANLRIIRVRNPEATRRLIFYELTWSDITAARKRVLDFDTSAEYARRRASFNNAMKGFLNDVGPDAMIYVADKENLILAATQQAVCWMLAGGEEGEGEIRPGGVCGLSSVSRLSNLEQQNILFITHSLGSRIIMDALGEIVRTLTDDRTVAGHPALVAGLQQKEMTVFMLSNQMPFLQIGLTPPEVTGQVESYCRPEGDRYARRAFKKLNIVAFNDPNDLLSYSIPRSFVERYLDSRICPALTNIHINVADRISAFGIEVVNPIAAHGNYDSDERVIELITHGNADLSKNELLSRRCRMIHIED